MKLNFEYGQGMMSADLPDFTDVFIPGETVKDPPFLKDPIAATKEAILNPIGMPTIAESVKKGSKIAIIFPDIVKGGNQETSHRKVSIGLVLDELYKAGVEKKDIVLICSNGLHRKMLPEELQLLLGDKVFDAFFQSGQIMNHDSEDWEHLIDLGVNEAGDRVIMNKYVYDADFAVLIGHVLGNPYGGYSGGYKHSATGITHWKCIGAHHIPRVMHRGDFTPVTKTSLMRQKFDQISRHMEKCMGKKFFCVDAVLDTQSRQIAVFAGYATQMQEKSWEVADKRTFVPWAEKKYDVLVFGAPQKFHYGNGMGTNPILLMQAISAQIIRFKRILSDRCVVICSSVCDGDFHDDEFPAYREIYDIFQKNHMNTLPDVEKTAEEVCIKKEYIEKYRFNNGFHPYHGYSMISCGHIAEMHTNAIYIVGAEQPGFARGMGMKTQATFESALKDARKYVGDNPNILALPQTFKMPAVHLGMKGETL